VLALPPATQQDLWTVHLEAYLRDHSNLTADQQSVIFDCIGQLALGVIEKNHADAAAARELDPGIRQLEARARVAFLPEEASTLFIRMGGPDAVARATTRTPLAVRCECSTVSDWCYDPTSPFWKCSRPYRCQFADGCGFLWQYACDGVCWG
jgi:hypothetical protein